MIDKIPMIKHYAIVSEETKKIYHEPYDKGDYGYTEDFKYTAYEVFNDLESLKNMIKYHDGKNKKYTVLEVSPMTVATEIVVTLK